ncbi:MAG: lipopolysaccharide heptosyltransferase II [Ignavibacteriaceae bacterium]|nr:lipopolysaccharide heptosyltransferase II [Ignavibacteriaceae bacterium]
MKNQNQNILHAIQMGAIKKILIVRFSSLGDVLLTSPFIRSLKKQFPNLIIDFVVKESYKDILVNNPYINKLYTLPSQKDKLLQFAIDLYENNYDLIVDLQNNFRSSSLIKKLNGRKTVFNKRTILKFLLVKFKINMLKDEPQIPLRYAETIPGFKLDPGGLDLFGNKMPNKKLEANNNLIGFCPGSRHFTKMWPKEYFIELGNILSKAGYRIVLFGGKSDKVICSELHSAITNSLSLCGDDDILQIAADMQMCKLVVCNDSGLMHAACAVKIPVIVFFGSTVKEFGFTPYKNKNLILENNSLSCRPCSHIGRASCPKGHFKCMLQLTPQLAYKNIVELLES